MALGKGRLVGEAYVLMRADGTLMKADMQRAASNAATLAGKDGGKAFRKSWNDEFKRLRADLNQGLARDLARLAGQKNFKPFVAEFRSVEDAAESLRKELDLFEKSGLFSQTMRKQVDAAFVAWRKDFEDMENDTRLIREENERLARSYDNVFGAKREARVRSFVSAIADAQIDKDFSKLVRKGEDLEDALKRIRAELNRVRTYASLTDDQMKEIRSDITVWAREQRKVAREAEKARLATDAHAESQRRLREETKRVATQVKEVKEEIEEIVHVQEDVDRDWLGRFRASIDGVDRRLIHFGDTTGRIFGKGGRNDFIHAIGTSIGFVTTQMLKLSTVIPKIAISSAELGSGFSQFVSILRGGGGIGAAFSALGKSVGRAFFGPQGIISAVAALGAGIFIFGKLIPGLVSSITGLVSGLGAMAGVMLNGVAAALLTTVPLIVSAGSAFGVFAYSVVQWATSDAGKNALKDFNKDLKALSRDLLPQVSRGFGLFADAGRAIFTDLVPALDEVFDRFYALFDRAGTRDALADWRETIVNAGADLSSAALTFSAGLINFFRPMLPYVEQFSQYLSDAADTFFEWAESAEGQTSIRDWFTSAISGFEDTIELVKQLGGLIGDIFFSDAAQTTGRGLIRDLAGWIRDIRTDLEANPEGLRDWFRDAGQITKDVGQLVVSIGDIVGELSDPSGRQAAQDLLTALRSIADVAADLASLSDTLANIADYAIIAITGILGATGVIDRTEAYESIIKRVGEIEVRKATAAAREARRVADEAAAQARALQFEGFVIEGSVQFNTDEYETLKQAIEDYQFDGKTIPIRGNRTLWDQVKGTVAGYVFDPKEVAVEADERQWTIERNLIANYKFADKTVKVDVDGPTAAALGAIRRDIEARLSGIRISITANGVTSGTGITLASGGVFSGATSAIIGEAGPEAVVPLNRPLNLVDPAVRELSAIAQGKQYNASGGVVGRNNVVVEPGAVVVTTRATSPGAVGSIVLGGIAEALASAY